MLGCALILARGSLEAMDYAFAVRVLLFVELPLNLLGIEEVKLVRLELEAGKGLKMVREPSQGRVLAEDMRGTLVRIHSTVCKLRTVLIIL